MTTTTMPATNLYNTYRPHTFAGVLGQPSIEVLKRQAQTHRFGHAYLLYGPSGSGKTTTARVLAMALNCEGNMNGNGEPCGVCTPCRNIIAGQHWDTIEIDAARFRGIEDMKGLAYKAHFAPMGKLKVYIIDECQMLTPEAFAVLLKLLEEPPPSLTIIMCTTERAKIPDTIASRCQLYEFGQLSPKYIVQQLAVVCQDIGIPASPEVLQMMAEKANGNCRAALNLLEQSIVL